MRELFAIRTSDPAVRRPVTKFSPRSSWSTANSSDWNDPHTSPFFEIPYFEICRCCLSFILSFCSQTASAKNLLAYATHQCTTNMNRLHILSDLSSNGFCISRDTADCIDVHTIGPYAHVKQPSKREPYSRGVRRASLLKFLTHQFGETRISPVCINLSMSIHLHNLACA